MNVSPINAINYSAKAVKNQQTKSTQTERVGVANPNFKASLTVTSSARREILDAIEKTISGRRKFTARAELDKGFDKFNSYLAGEWPMGKNIIVDAINSGTKIDYYSNPQLELRQGKYSVDFLYKPTIHDEASRLCEDLVNAYKHLRYIAVYK